MGPRRRLTALSVASLATVAILAAPAVAQDPSPEPLAVGRVVDLTTEFPDGIGDRPWQDIAIVSGPELFAGLDPGNEADASRIRANQELLDAADRDRADLTSVTAVRFEDDGSFSVLNAYQIAGADPDVVRDVVLQQFADSYISVMAEPSVDVVDIDGLSAVLVSDQALLDADGRARSVYLVASGDTVWTVDVDEEFVVETISGIPRAE